MKVSDAFEGPHSSLSKAYTDSMTFEDHDNSVANEGTEDFVSLAHAVADSRSLGELVEQARRESTCFLGRNHEASEVRLELQAQIDAIVEWLERKK